MPFRPNRLIALAIPGLIALLTSCAPVHHTKGISDGLPDPVLFPRSDLPASPAPMTTTTVDARAVRTVEQAAVLIAEAHNQEQKRTMPHIRIGTATSVTIDTVLACIRQHESGDYTEHSHLGSGSGAYQFIKSTWTVWSERAGYPGYAFPYEAPAAVQDAVTTYALTHGGAGNWSTRWGNDPCTSGLPGGG